MTWTEVRDKCSKHRRWHSRQNPWSAYVTKYPSFFITSFCINRGISANKVTLVSWIIGVMGCGLFLIDTWAACVVGGSCLVVYKMLDLVDGDVSRLTNTSSPFGHLLDCAADLTMQTLVPLTVGLHLYLITEAPIYLLLGGIYASCSPLGKLMVAQHNLKSPQTIVEKVEGFRLASIGVSLTHLDIPVLLICSITNTLPIFLIIFTTLYFGRMVGAVGITLIKSYREKVEEGG